MNFILSHVLSGSQFKILASHLEFRKHKADHERRKRE